MLELFSPLIVSSGGSDGVAGPAGGAEDEEEHDEVDSFGMAACISIFSGSRLGWASMLMVQGFLKNARAMSLYSTAS